MDENKIKELITQSKNINTDNLFLEGYYFEFKYLDNWVPSFINNVSGNKILFSLIINQEIKNYETKKKKESCSFFRENIDLDAFHRNVVLNKEILEMNLKDILLFLTEQEKIIIEEKPISNYDLSQLLNGKIIDIIIKLTNYNNNINNNNNSKFIKEIINIILKILYYITNKLYNDSKLLKIFYIGNRKLLLVDRNFSLISSFDLLFLFSHYLYKNIKYDSDKENLIIYQNIIKLTYEMIIKTLETKEYNIPLLLFYLFIIVFNNINNKNLMENFSYEKLFEAFLAHTENLSEVELKSIKNTDYISDAINKILTNINKPTQILYKLKDKFMNVFFYRCLISKSLEKQINAINFLADEIYKSFNQNKLNENLYDFFIKDKNILKYFIENSTHEEILKRTHLIFKYFAKYDKIDDSIINFLENKIKTNVEFKNILCEIIMGLPIKKREKIFNEILQNLDIYNNSDDIEILKNITNSCLIFSSSLSYNISFNSNNNKNLYGIEVLFDYIINIDDHIEKNEKDKNNIDIEKIKNNLKLMLEAFEFLLSNPKLIKSNVVYSYLDRSFEIIKEDKKNNILCILMISKIFNEYFGENIKNIKIKR